MTDVWSHQGEMPDFGCIRLMGMWSIHIHGEWFQLKWPESWECMQITVKEYVPIVVGVEIWGRQWEGR